MDRQKAAAGALAPLSPKVMSTFWADLDSPTSECDVVRCNARRSRFEQHLVKTLGRLIDFALPLPQEALGA